MTELLQALIDVGADLSEVDDSVLDALLEQLANAEKAVKVIDADRKRLKEVIGGIYRTRGIKEFESAAGTAKLIERSRVKWNYNKLREMIGEDTWNDIVVLVEEVDEDKRNKLINEGTIPETQVEAATDIQRSFYFKFKENTE